MARQTFRVSGRVINRTTRRAVGGLRVEAWDRDIKLNDPLGSAITDQKGSFRIAYDLSAFNDERRRPRPDLFFKVFQGRKLVATTASMPIENAGRRRTVTIEVDVTERKTRASSRGAAGTKRAADDGGNAPNEDIRAAEPGASPEVSIHELGESVAASLANVQHELDRYQSPLGAFVVDEIDLTIPVKMRVDSMGQVMVIVTDEAAAGTPGITQVHLRIKPVLGSHTEPMMAGTQPLTDVTAIKDMVNELRTFRIFTVNDYRRVIRTPQGRTALMQQLGWNESMMKMVNDQVQILTLPVLPVAVSSVMTTRLNFRNVQQFLGTDSQSIADAINDALENQRGSEVTAEHVDCWKQETKTFLAVRVPCIQETADGGKRLGRP